MQEIFLGIKTIAYNNPSEALLLKVAPVIILELVFFGQDFCTHMIKFDITLHQLLENRGGSN